MKNAFRLALITIISTIFVLILGGCNKTEDAVSSVSLKDYDPNNTIEIAVGDFDYNAYTVVVTRKSGATEQIALSEEMIAEADLLKPYQIGDHEIAVHYGGQKCTFKLSVKRATFGELSFPENNVFTYNGKAHTVEVDGEIPANAVVTYIGGNSFVNAGTYDVTAVVSCEGYVTQTLSTTVKIERAKYDMSGVRFNGKEVVYDGSSHSVHISGTLPQGVASPTYTINGKAGSSATDVGEYTVKAAFTSSNPNYEAIPEMEAKLKITPAEYTVKGVDIVFKSESGNVISGATKIYDGKSITFDLNDYSKLSKKITVAFSVYDEDGKVISTSNKKTNILEAGVYTARVEFAMADGNNYKPISPIERTFEVLKAEYPPLQNIQFTASQSTYDGNAHSIEIEGRLPTGVTVSYEYYKDGKLLVDGEGKPVKSVVDAGRYTVKAIFTHTDTNRNEIAPLSAVLNITAMRFNVSNLGVELNGTDVYDGTEKAVSVIGQLPDEINAVVIYYQNGSIMENATSVIEPGEYYVHVQFVPTSNNYVIGGVLEYAFMIKKAMIDLNGIERDGDREYIYNGGGQSPSIKAGTVPDRVNVTEQLFSIGANGDRTAVASAVNAGNYVKVVTVTPDEPTRYQLSNSGVIEWAFEIRPQLIDVSGINIVAENFIYNGRDQKPQLMGVPEHVLTALKVYPSDGSEAIENAVDAGSYRCEVIFTPENSNYVLTSYDVIECAFEITPQTIDVSGINIVAENFIYNGREQKPQLMGVLPEHVLTELKVYPSDGSEAIENAVDAGSYRCEVIFTPENSNYVLLNNEKLIAVYEISPITIVDIDSLPKDFYIEVSDSDGLYKWEEDDPVIKNAISTAIFGEYSDYAKISSFRTPQDVTTNTWLTPSNNSIDPNAIYDLKCNLLVDANYGIFYDGQLRSGTISATIKIKFIVDNNT